MNMVSFTGFDMAVGYLVTNFRWLFVCVFLLPCTIIYDFLALIRKFWSYYLPKEPSESHLVKTKFIQDQVKQWKCSGANIPMCTARPGWKAMTLREPQYKKTMYNIHIDLDQILDINVDTQTVKVEPLVSMGQLTAELRSKNFTLPIVAELEDLTVGGLVMGQGVESSSHIYGFFHNICVSFELVLADGSLVHCSKDEDPDLFYSIPCSYGTLGFLTAVELKIIPSKRFVKLKYEPMYSLEKAAQMFEIKSRDKNENHFLEGIMFSLDTGVIMTGQMVDIATNVKSIKNTISSATLMISELKQIDEPNLVDIPLKFLSQLLCTFLAKIHFQLNEISRWYKPWFYEHAKSCLSRGEFEECIPLRDYYHRHTKSIFWELQDIVPFGNHPLFRWTLGWAMPPKISFLKLTQTRIIKELYDKHHVVQDLIVPIKHVKNSMIFFQNTVDVYPVWLCPVIVFNEPGLVHSYCENPEMYVDIGLYGTPKYKNYEYVTSTKKLENFVVQCKGYQMLYAGTYCSEEEFCEMFDHSLYNRIRERLQCHKAFPNVYGKVNRKVRD